MTRSAMNSPYFVHLAGAVMLLVFLASVAEAREAGTTVNAAIGDESYVETFGTSPHAATSELVRIQTHLRYVEAVLRSRPVDSLTPSQRSNRLAYLDFLREYWQEGAFPHNDGHPDKRRPTFISDDGNICAVGYLVERSVGREVAEIINESHKYAYIGEIELAVFNEWAAASGFTLEELAMIQPMYGGEPHVTETNRNHVEAPYALSASVLTLSNAFMMISGSSDPWFGLATGGGTILLGALNVDNRTVRDGICIGWSCSRTVESNHLRTGVSYTLIGVGAANVLVSGYRLITGRADESDSAVQMGLTQVSSSAMPGESVPAVQVRVRF